MGTSRIGMTRSKEWARRRACARGPARDAKPQARSKAKGEASCANTVASWRAQGREMWKKNTDEWGQMVSERRGMKLIPRFVKKAEVFRGFLNIDIEI